MMVPDILAEQFALLAEAPNGLQRLRELVVELAVRGKVIRQVPVNETIDELIDRLGNKRSAMIEKGMIRAQKTLSSPTPENTPFVIPATWQWVRLGSLIASMTNGIYKPARFYSDDGIACLRMYNIRDGRINFTNVKRMILDDNETQQYGLEAGDILVNRVNSRELVGKAGIVTPITEPVVFESKNIRVRLLEPEELAEYINLFLQTRMVRHVFDGDAKQTCGQASISQPQIANLATPLPPVAEQHRIVAKVDELMALCDELDQRQQERSRARVRLVTTSHAVLTSAPTPKQFARHWQRIHDNFDLLHDTPDSVQQLRQTVRELAVRGLLVPQNAADQPASDLLEKLTCAKERLIEAKNIPKSMRLPPLVLNATPFQLPYGWTWARIGDLASIVEYGTSRKASPSEKGVPVLRMNNIQDGEVVLDNLKYVPDSIDDLPRLYLRHNDLLFNRTNSYELVGKTGLFKGDDDQYTFASYLIRVALLPGVNPDFVNTAMNAAYYRRTQIEPEVTQQCGQANFNGTKLKHSLIPLPPENEQGRIVAVVDQLMALCDELESKLTKSLNDSENLMEAVVHHLLNGSEAPAKTPA